MFSSKYNTEKILTFSSFLFCRIVSYESVEGEAARCGKHQKKTPKNTKLFYLSLQWCMGTKRLEYLSLKA